MSDADVPAFGPRCAANARPEGALLGAPDAWNGVGPRAELMVMMDEKMMV